jgi:hypothetical protein
VNKAETGILKFFMVILLIPIWKNAEATFSSNLPLLKITTENNQQIIRESRRSAKIEIIYNGPGQRNFYSDYAGHFSGNVEIRIRGNSTAGWPKKPYDFKIADEQGENRNASLLGMPEHEDWLLLASYLDHSFIRTPLAKHLSMMQGRWASKSRMVEVFLNGEYQGIYILIEKIKRSNRRLGVERLERHQITYPDITGGYIYEISGQKNNLGETRELNYPDFDKAAPEQIAYIRQYDDNFRNAMRSADYTDHYQEWIDADSFVDELIVQEAMRNSDAYGWSAYFHKRREGKINAGPVWDFDQSAGNSSYPDNGVATGWLYAHHLTNNTPFFWKLLMDDPVFKYKVKTRWESLREDVYSTENLMHFIDSIADLLSEPQSREFQKWPVLGVNFWRETHGYQSRNTYRKEVDYLKSFLKQRWLWMDQELARVSHPDSVNSPPSGNLDASAIVFPNPATDNVSFTITSEYNTEAVINIYLSSGSQLIHTSRVTLNKGENNITLPLEGSIIPGIYIYSIKLKNPENRKLQGKFIKVD